MNYRIPYLPYILDDPSRDEGRVEGLRRLAASHCRSRP
jgi:hypothetical protein